MKVIYKAEDGTEFDKESNCKDYEETRMAIEAKNSELVEIAHNFEPYTGFTAEHANFIIENIQKINEILGIKSQDCSCIIFEEKYRAVPETNSCEGCSFDETNDYCRPSWKFHDCAEHNIIWIKK